MDTSETYIKMCEKAEEITGKWNPHCRGQNDFWWAEVESDLNGRGICMKISEMGAKTKYIWIPRQDQLQEMVDDESSYPVSHQLLKIEAFFKTIDWWEGKDGDHGEITWEQLWLAFVMKEKFNKTWDGAKWG